MAPFGGVSGRSWRRVKHEKSSILAARKVKTIRLAAAQEDNATVDKRPDMRNVAVGLEVELDMQNDRG